MLCWGSALPGPGLLEPGEQLICFPPVVLHRENTFSWGEESQKFLLALETITRFLFSRFLLVLSASCCTPLLEHGTGRKFLVSLG